MGVRLSTKGERDGVCQTCKNARFQSKRHVVDGHYVTVKHPCPVCRKKQYTAWLRKNK